MACSRVEYVKMLHCLFALCGTIELSITYWRNTAAHPVINW